MTKINEEMRTQLENSRREKLRREKPLVYDKIIKYSEKEAKGEPVPVIDFSYDYLCNMHCTHCSNACFAPKDTVLTLEKLRDLARQADEMGLAQFVISGGEPLTFPNLDDIILALNPQKFHISMSTNGLLLTKEKARHLKEMGVDKLKISLDSINEEVYNQTRQQSGAYHQAINAIMEAKAAGLQVTIQTVISHQNCITKDTELLAKFAHENEMNMDIMIAKAVGRWEGHEEVLITPEDNEFLIQLRNKYPEVQRDTFPTYGKCGGCSSFNRSIHITKYGDVLSCAFLQISLGNIFEEPLKDILDRALSIKWFHGHHPLCLSGEDRDFIRKYISKTYGKPLPLSWKEAFTEEDFIH
nr:radical SAM protein [uncultured Agathobaculum sp.]